MRLSAIVALLFVVIGSLRIVSTYTVFNHTVDEPDNLGPGLEFWTTGRALQYNENPPLARIFAGALPFLAGERFHAGPEAPNEGIRILGTGGHYTRILALARAGILPFFWMACAVVFLWGLRAAGPFAAAAATAIFTAIPPVLALAGIVNTDMAVCATVSAAALMTLHWAGRPTARRSLSLGCLIGLACVSKFTAIPYLAATWIAMALVEPAIARTAWKHRRLAAVALAAAAFTIWAVYGFSFARVDSLHARLPAPRFFAGLEWAYRHQASGHPAYLFGQRSADGFWYYFPAVLAIKLPIALWILAAAACAFRPTRRVAALPLAFSAAILLAAMTSRVNIGVRYVLPMMTGLSVAAGCALAAARTRTSQIAAAVLAAWLFASGALQHPDYLSYTNELAGAHPERFVADSDLDWGQDMKRLADFLREQHADHVTFTPFNRTYPLAVPVSPGDTDRPSPGWNAVSITIWKVFGFPAWADHMPPPHRIGRGILVWYQSEPRLVARP